MVKLLPYKFRISLGFCCQAGLAMFPGAKKTNFKDSLTLGSTDCSSLMWLWPATYVAKSGLLGFCSACVFVLLGFKE